jgi:hypothetical protein
MVGWQRVVGYQEEVRAIGSESGRVVVDETILPIDVGEG